MKIARLRRVLQRAPWLEDYLLEFAGIDPLFMSSVRRRQLLCEFASAYVRRVSFRSFERLDLESRNARWVSDLTRFRPELTTGSILTVEKYRLLGHLENEARFTSGVLEADHGLFYPSTEAPGLEEGARTIRQAIWQWSEHFRRTCSRTFFLDAVINVSTFAMNEVPISDFDIYRSPHPFTLSEKPRFYTPSLKVRRGPRHTGYTIQRLKPERQRRHRYIPSSDEPGYD